MAKEKIQIFAAWLVLCLASNAADLSLKVADNPAPKEVEASLRPALQSRAIQLLENDKPVYEFWFVSEIPLTGKPSSPAKALDSVKQATFLGVVSVARTSRDYRDDELASGVYTMRFALQPQDGNHLGTAESPYFAVLIPAKTDTRLDGIKDYKPMVKASSKETSTDHPVILSLFPATGDGAEARLTQPAADHKGVRVKVPAKVSGSGEKTNLTFDIVYEGKGKK